MPVYGVYVEPDNKWGHQPHIDKQRQQNKSTFAVLVQGAKSDIWKESKGQEKTTEEAKDVSNVVNPGQKATGEKEENNT